MIIKLVTVLILLISRFLYYSIMASAVSRYCDVLTGLILSKKDMFFLILRNVDSDIVDSICFTIRFYISFAFKWLNNLIKLI